MGELVQELVAGAIVLAALVFLYGQFSGTFAQWRRRRKPDVPLSSLVRKRTKPKAPEPR